MKAMNDVETFFTDYQDRINHQLAERLPALTDSPSWLHQAMRYCALSGGKRFRALLVYACAHAVGVREDHLIDPLACAVELIHAYSLIHDDLPAMDNSDLRRGKPTCHLAFDEATAILAGDALQALAFEILAAETTPLSPEKRLHFVIHLAKACGTRGMAGGQALDLEAEKKILTLNELIHLHRLKTGALIECAALFGAELGADTDSLEVKGIKAYAAHVGLAFQIKDDILDLMSDTSLLGKPKGLDARNEKSTFVRLLGLEDAHLFLLQEYEHAIAALAALGLSRDSLIHLADFAVHRMY